MALQTERKDEPRELKGPFNLRIRDEYRTLGMWRKDSYGQMWEH